MSAGIRTHLTTLLKEYLNDPENQETCKTLLTLLEKSIGNTVCMKGVPMGYYLAGMCAKTLGHEEKALEYLEQAIGKGQAGKDTYSFFAQKMKDRDPKRYKMLFEQAGHCPPESTRFRLTKRQK